VSRVCGWNICGLVRAEISIGGVQTPQIARLHFRDSLLMFGVQTHFWCGPAGFTPNGVDLGSLEELQS